MADGYLTAGVPQDGELVLAHDWQWDFEIQHMGRDYSEEHGGLVGKSLSRLIDVDVRRPLIRILDPHWERIDRHRYYDAARHLFMGLVVKYGVGQSGNPIEIRIITKNHSTYNRGKPEGPRLTNWPERDIWMAQTIKKYEDREEPDPQQGMRLHDRWILGHSCGVQIGSSFKDMLNRDVTISPMRGQLFCKASLRYKQLWGESK